MQSSAKRYLITSAFFFVALLPALVAVEAARRVATCDSEHYTASNFIGYCWDHGFAAYEKGAYYLPTEPAALAAAKRADILFLGNSRMEYAFSNEVLDRFSKQTGYSHYTLGFAGEGARFIESLIERHDLRPKVVVINLDGAEFFYSPPMPDALRLMARPLPGWVEYLIKKLGQEIQRRSCTGSNAMPVLSRVCGKDDAIFRETGNGHWQFDHRPNFAENFPMVAEPGPPSYWDGHRQAILTDARRFARSMQQRGVCVIFTNVPSEDSSLAIAREQASAADVPIILPAMEGLRTFDHSHLGPDSSRRFTGAVLKELRPLLDRCGK